MAGLHDFKQGSHCHRKTWINILLGILQLLSPCIQRGGAQLQGECSPFICRFMVAFYLHFTADVKTEEEQNGKKILNWAVLKEDTRIK